MLSKRELFGQSQTASAICQIHHNFKEYCEKGLKPYGLDAGVYFYLIYIIKNPGKYYSEIIEYIQSNNTQSIRDIQKLEIEGYIYIKKDVVDKEKARVYPTPKGEMVLEEVQIIFQTWESIAMKDLDKDEKSELIKLIEKIKLI